MSRRPDKYPHATSTRVLRRIVSLNHSNTNNATKSNHRDDRWSHQFSLSRSNSLRIGGSGGRSDDLGRGGRPALLSSKSFSRVTTIGGGNNGSSNSSNSNNGGRRRDTMMMMRPSLSRSNSLPVQFGPSSSSRNHRDEYDDGNNMDGDNKFHSSFSELSPKVPTRKDYFDKFTLKFAPEFIRRSSRNLFCVVE